MRPEDRGQNDGMDDWMNSFGIEDGWNENDWFFTARQAIVIRPGGLRLTSITRCMLSLRRNVV